MRIVPFVLAIALASPACADPPIVADADGVIVVQPAEVDTFSCRFLGRTLSSAGSATVTLRKTKQADASPSGLLSSGPTIVGTTDLKVVVSPDNGCGTAGCRAGNEYEIALLPTDSNSNKPACNLYVIVQRKHLLR